MNVISVAIAGLSVQRLSKHCPAPSSFSRLSDGALLDSAIV